MKKTLFFISTLIILLIPCGAAYAYDGVEATENSITIEPASPAAIPQINVYGNAIGGVEKGDLFYIDVSDTTIDTLFTLYITNVDELVHSYRYMNLNVGIYIQTGPDSWEKITTMTGEPYPDTYITTQNGLINFTLPGNAKYKITIDNGCYKSYPVISGQSIAIPDFYLTAS